MFGENATKEQTFITNRTDRVSSNVVSLFFIDIFFYNPAYIPLWIKAILHFWEIEINILVHEVQFTRIFKL